MRKVYPIIILLLVSIFILFPKVTFANQYWEKENKKREQVYETALKSYMDQFLLEDTPEEDRITSYEMNGYGLAQNGETEEKLYVSITFSVTPVNENNTTWSSYRNHCYAVFLKGKDEYILDRISRYPDHYDEFLQRFEEYKKNKQEQTQKTEIQGERKNSLANQEMQKINLYIVVGFAILFVIASGFLWSFIRKRKGEKL